MTHVWMAESMMRGAGRRASTRKSSAMWLRLAVTRIMPTITIQIMVKTRSSSAPMNTMPKM